MLSGYKQIPLKPTRSKRKVAYTIDRGFVFLLPNKKSVVVIFLRGIY